MYPSGVNAIGFQCTFSHTGLLIEKIAICVCVPKMKDTRPRGISCYWQTILLTFDMRELELFQRNQIFYMFYLMS